METGRKFWISILGMVLCTFRPESAAEVAGIVMVFNGVNGYVTAAFAKSDSTSRALTGTSDIERRRDPVLGIEPTP